MKVAIVYSFKESEWFSCTLIIKNLLKAYENYFGKENIFFINYGRDGYVDAKDLLTLKEKKIKKILFVDHKPTPSDFLKALKKFDGGQFQDEREYYIHVFGDFPLYLDEWRDVFPMLKKEKVKMICASEKQKNYLAHYFQSDEHLCVCPFPVDIEHFHFDDELKNKYRKKYGVEESEYVYLFTGRIARQKRVTDLVTLFYKGLRTGQIQDNSQLLIVGPFDYLGSIYLDLIEQFGEYFRDLDNVIQSEPELAKNVKLIGQVDHNELSALYNLADCYVSLSTYHDEDYGMSVAEALCTGLPAVLTNWGGYSSFQTKENSDLCRLVDVKLGRMTPKINEEQVLQALSLIQKKDFKRDELALKNQSFLSIASIEKRLNDIFQAAFTSLPESSEIMSFLINEHHVNNFALFRGHTDVKFNEFYYKLYEAYVR